MKHHPYLETPPAPRNTTCTWKQDLYLKSPPLPRNTTICTWKNHLHLDIYLENVCSRDGCVIQHHGILYTTNTDCWQKLDQVVEKDKESKRFGSHSPSSDRKLSELTVVKDGKSYLQSSIRV